MMFSFVFNLSKEIAELKHYALQLHPTDSIVKPVMRKYATFEFTYKSIIGMSNNI